jgi:hypothetical protein
MKQEEKRRNQNAFPITLKDNNNPFHRDASGMSLRDYYYAAALTGLLSNPNVVKELDQDLSFINDVGLAATLYADTLIDKGWEE